MRVSSLKESLRSVLLATHSAHFLRTWFDPLAFHWEEETKTLCIVLPHSFFLPWLEQEGMESLKKAITTYFITEKPSIQYQIPNKTLAVTPLQKHEYFPTASEYTSDNFITNVKTAFPLAMAIKTDEHDTSVRHLTLLFS